MVKPYHTILAALLIGAIILVAILVSKKTTAPSANTITLLKGANQVHYIGATADLPDALTNIQNFVEIIWHQSDGTWERFYFYQGFPMGELTELGYGKDYTITVTADCIWGLPQ